MLQQLFGFLLENSAAITVVICVVLLARLLLCRAPARYRVLLWMVVWLRLLLPVGIASEVSVFNYVGTEQIRALQTSLRPNTETPAQNKADGGAETPKTTPAAQRDWISDAEAAGATLRQTPALPYVWMAGAGILLLYTAFLVLRMRTRLRTAVRLRDGVWESDRIPAPFVWGVFRPKIYLPFGLEEAERAYILRHEQGHIRRKDPLVKGLAYLLVCVYWFHPLVWLTFLLMARDMEMCCDEYALKDASAAERAQYSRSLLGFASNRRSRSMGMAFGESNVRKRVKNIMKAKKQGVWIGVGAAVLILLVAAACLTGKMYRDRDNENASTASAANQAVNTLVSIQDITGTGAEEQRLWSAIQAAFPATVVDELRNNGGVIRIPDADGETAILFKNVDPKKSDPTADPTLRLDFTLKNGVLTQYESKEYGFVEGLPESRISEQAAKTLVQNFGAAVLQNEAVQAATLQNAKVLAGYEGGDYIAFTDPQGGFYQVDLTKNLVDHYLSKEAYQ